ncbi:hypothetical protein N8768_05005 [Flavobacteriaceae bacterium]|jgi:hypothetical protein|nr:hypothetical protein [Flavobacteriaceae bacterium]
MKKIKCFIFIFIGFSTATCISQVALIQGQVFGSSDVEGIHVINKTSNKFSTTNTAGFFDVQAKINDTIVFSSVQYKLVSVIVTSKVFREQAMDIFLEEQVNNLPEITVGKILSGDLEYDLKNNEMNKPIDFYDVGIPGYIGKPKTQSERRLHEADAGKLIPYIGFGFVLNVHKLLNAISGRTKMLKQRVKQESDIALLNAIKRNVSTEFFRDYPLNKNLREEFFYFCSDDENFEIRCKDKSNIEIYDYLIIKYNQYVNNDKKF